MNSFTAALTGTGIAAAIGLTTILMMPTPNAPLADTGSGNSIEIDIRDATLPVANGEVITTIHAVTHTDHPRKGTATVGRPVHRLTGHDNAVNLPPGEYLVRARAVSTSDLANVDDTDGASHTVPTGSGCLVGPIDCSWITVTESTWKIHGVKRFPERLVFTFGRPSTESAPPDTSRTAPPTTSPTTQPVVEPLTGTPTPKGIPVNVILYVVDVSNRGKTEPAGGVATLVKWAIPDDHGAIEAIDLTDEFGNSIAVIPNSPYEVSITLPTNYELVPGSEVGSFPALRSGPDVAHLIAIRRIGSNSGASSTGVSTTTTSTTTSTTASTSPDPTSTTVLSDTSPNTTTPTTTEPIPTTTEPAPSTTAPVTTTTEPTSTTTEPAASGCEDTADPDRQIAHAQNGVIEWIDTNGNVVITYPEPGMAPIPVCAATYQRLVDAGIPPEFLSIR